MTGWEPAVRALLVSIEGSALGHFMRDTGPWTYAIINVAHVLGVATLFGSVLVVDLRLLGLGRGIPLAAVASATVPVTAGGLFVALVSGSALLATKATAYIHNPFLYIKFLAIVLGLANVIALNLMPAWRSLGARDPSWGEQRTLAMLGGCSLVFWLTAVACGRMIAYW